MPDYTREYAVRKLDELKEFCRKHERMPLRDEDSERYPGARSIPREVARCIQHGLLTHQEMSDYSELCESYSRNISCGEAIADDYLRKKGYCIKKQYTFPDCRDEKVLPFDTAIRINGQLCLIEVDGEQHYGPVDAFGGKEKLRDIQRHDRIKDDYCSGHGIPLLRIRYDEIRDAEDIIDRFEDEVLEDQRGPMQSGQSGGFDR